MDGAFQNKCFGLPDDFDCDSCHYNVGFQTGWGGVVGPCGQQNCWYSCTACMRYISVTGVQTCALPICQARNHEGITERISVLLPLLRREHVQV